MNTTRGSPTLMSELASAQTIYRIQHVMTAWGLWARDNSSMFSVIHQSRDDTCQCRCLEKEFLPCVKCLFTPESVSEYNTKIYKYQTRYIFFRDSNNFFLINIHQRLTTNNSWDSSPSQIVLFSLFSFLFLACCILQSSFFLCILINTGEQN